MVQGVALQPAAAPWNVLEVRILGLQPRPTESAQAGVGHQSVVRSPRGSDAWEDLRTAPVAPVMQGGALSWVAGRLVPPPLCNLG